MKEEHESRIVAEHVRAKEGLCVYRSMRQTKEGPEIGAGARTLGVRPGGGLGTDIPVDPEGNVYPRTGGLSVAPDDPMNLPPVRRPKSLGGLGKDPVWCLDANALAEGHVYRADPRNPDRHGFIEPARVMEIGELQDLLGATRPQWKLV